MKYAIKLRKKLQESCRNTSRWCLQNYMGNGWELTSEFQSKWITFKNIQSNFNTNLINNFWSTQSNFEKNYKRVAVIPADGACKITWETGHHRLVLRQLSCNFFEVWLRTSKVNNEISVKFDWIFLKVIHLDCNSDVNSQPFSM